MQHTIRQPLPGQSFEPVPSSQLVALLEIVDNGTTHRYLSQCKDWQDAQDQAGAEIAKRVQRGQIKNPSSAILSTHQDGRQTAVTKLF